MAQFLKELLTALGGFAVVIAALAWLVRNLISQYLSRNVEAYKAQLLLETTRQTESLKSALETAAHERAVRFSKLQEKRDEHLPELYRSIHSASVSIGVVRLSLLALNDGYAWSDFINFQIEETHKDALEASRQIGRAKLYLNKALSHKLQELREMLLRPIMTLRVYLHQRPEQREDLARQILQSTESIGYLIESTLADIEQEFRVLLGSEATTGGVEIGTQGGGSEQP